MLSWWKKDSQKDVNPYYLEALQRFEAGDWSMLKDIYHLFVLKDAVMMQRAAKSIYVQLSTCSSNQMIQLEKTFRTYSSLEWYASWEKVDITFIKENIKDKRERFYVFVLGTFHPNGYFREKCMTELSRDQEAFPYILLRMNDWVRPIREKAAHIAYTSIEHIPIETLLISLPYLDKLLKGRRGDQESVNNLYKKVKEHIERDICQINWDDVKDYELNMRKAIYKLILDEPLLELEYVNRLLEREKSIALKGYIMGRILRLYACSENQINLYLENKTSQIRYKALVYKYEKLKGTWEGVENLLLDLNRGIREYTCYVMRKHSKLDLIDFYTAHLGDEKPYSAIMGIGEQGSKGDIEKISPFLGSDEPKRVRIALKAMTKLLKEEGKPLYEHYLFNEQPSISKVAYIALKDYEIKLGEERLYQALEIESHKHVKRYLVLLLLREKSWSRLPYLILLYDYEEERLRAQIRQSIHYRNMYEEVSIRQEEKIKQALTLKNESLPKEVVQRILLDLKYVVKR